jgi:NAD(P)-dependent dehydrogenase (short-subunit alcohol dehydrogenase family)
MTQPVFTLANRTALVTGASSGIGAVLAQGLSAAGATVVLAARRAEPMEQLVDQLEQAGGKAVAVTMDVTRRDHIRQAFDLAEGAVGTIDLVINNAGVAGPKNFAHINDAERDLILNTNFKGVWNVAQEAAQRLIQAGKPGSIVNIASVLGLLAAPSQSSYCASKAAVIQLTRVMALDLMRHNIRVNAVAPGWFKTDINAEYFASAVGQAHIQRMPARRLGELHELIGPVLLLCSEAGSFINGAVLPVDGAVSSGGV